MREGVVVLDAAGNLVMYNRALQEMLFLGSSIQGKPAAEVFEHAEFLALLSGAIEGISSSQELTFERPTAKVFLANVRRLPPRGALAVLVDITEQRHLETVRQEFVANASHELRTPIAAISSAVETLQGAAAGDLEAGAGFLRMIERNAQRLTTLVDDLLSLSSIESGRLDVKLESVRLTAAVEATLNNFVAAARNKQTDLVSLVPADIYVQATPRGLEHVLGNLVDNAIKYCPPGSRVRVEVEQQPDVVVITVSDNGPGIPEAHRERVFERFYRVDAGRSRALGGTGLGLAIVKHWVEAMHGTISVTCPGEGTQFRVALAPTPNDLDT
jgi:two-component system phosphate regulon sensor histidine kinase PhoR